MSHREGLSVGQEHELLSKLKKAGISSREANALINSLGNELADQVVALIAEVAKDTQAQYERLFDSQIATLRDRDTPAAIVELLANQRDSVISKASEETREDGHIPFLPVIPRTYRSPYDLMAMVRNGSKVGYTYLNPTEITDEVKTPNEPYYIYDVEDGEATRGKSPESVQMFFESQGRYGLTAAEVMALTTHTDVLWGHYVFATGSRCDSVDRMPLMWLDDGEPRLHWSHVDSHSLWGSPSCGSR